MFILYIMIYNLLWSCNNPILNSIVYCFREQPFKLENKQFKQTFLIVFLFNKIYKYCVFRKWNTTTWDFSFFFLDCWDFSFCSVLYIYKSKNIYTFQYDFHGVILVKRKGEFGLKYMILSFKNQMDVKANGVSFTRHKFPDYEDSCYIVDLYVLYWVQISLFHLARALLSWVFLWSNSLF
jgi:hypothetical protein